MQARLLWAVAPLALTSGTAAWAQAAKSPADLAAAFGARERILDASLSPDGTKVAFVTPGPKQSTLVEVLDLTNGKSEAVNSADGDPMHVIDCGWASNRRLVCRLYGVSNTNYGMWLAYTRLVAMDADGANPLALAAMGKKEQYAQTSDGYVIDWRDGSTAKVLLARTYVPGESLEWVGGSTSAAKGLGVDLLDTETGKGEHVESADSLVGAYLADGQGKVRIKGGDETQRVSDVSRGIITYHYRLQGSNDWKPFSTYSTVTEEGMYPVAVDGSANVAYVLQKLDGRDALYRVALDGSMKTELAFAHPKVDVRGVARTGRAGRIVGARYTLERPEISYFDPKFAQLMQSLHRALPALPLVTIVDSSADGTKHLVYAASDTNAGRYFILDQAAKRMTPIGDARPELGEVPLSTMKSVTYKAADGTEVPAYLTLPAGSEGKKIPAIVMPHGGPASRDNWGFDWLVQFFAARGYAVLQPNFRGSAGYGDNWFLDNGFKSWRTAIGDVTDAGRWLVSQGIADPDKLAIVGWSYGGYAALQANVLDPTLFKAVVAIAPVTDLGKLRGENAGFTTSKLTRDYIGDGPHIDEGSPARHADKFVAPVLMFHGDKDINVNVAESRYMDKQLSKAGKQSELIVYPKIDHQLEDSAVRADMLARTDAFLSKALKR